MRTIKFRAWNKKAQRRATYEELLGDIKVGATVNPPSILKIEDENYDIMQSTGLLDKNGDEIYEGDILESTRPAKDKYLVVWDQGDAAFYAKDLHFESLWKIPSNQNCMIIGNMYEDPELMDQ